MRDINLPEQDAGGHRGRDHHPRLGAEVPAAGRTAHPLMRYPALFRVVLRYSALFRAILRHSALFYVTLRYYALFPHDIPFFYAFSTVHMLVRWIVQQDKSRGSKLDAQEVRNRMPVYMKGNFKVEAARDNDGSTEKSGGGC